MTDDVIPMEFDLNQLEWQDLEDIEEIVGHPIGNELAGGQISVRTIRALVLWKLRKDGQPLLTLETMPEIGKVSVAFRQGKQLPNGRQRKPAQQSAQQRRRLPSSRSRRSSS